MKNTFPAEFDVARASQLALEYYGISAEAIQLPGEFDLNFYLKTKDEEEYILKIAHHFRDEDLLDLENQAIQYVGEKQVLSVPEVIFNLQGKTITQVTDQEGNIRRLRLLKWVPGRLFAHVNPQTVGLRESLGAACGQLAGAFVDFQHELARRNLNWDPSNADWIEEKLSVFSDPEERRIVDHFLNLFRERAKPLFPHLRKSVGHYDANNYNVVVSGDLSDPTVSGVIDFGDVTFSHSVNELAIAIAYACMGQPDPLSAAADVVRGYHRAFPLQEAECEALFSLVGARLIISVTNSALNKRERPDNEYLLISERPAWELLKKLVQISPDLAHYTFRQAAGFDPVPHAAAFRKWAENLKSSFHPITSPDPLNSPSASLDFSVGSLALGNAENYLDTDTFEKRVGKMLDEAGVETGTGGYGEVRPFYTTDEYASEGNAGSRWRTVHLGLDIWRKEAGAPVFALLGGVVHSFADNDQDRDYGPTIILVHKVAEELTFYTLYGHLSRTSMEGLEVGQSIEAGEQFAWVGGRPENGNWPPHLHFQILLDTLGNYGDFPGATFFEEKEIWMSICPDPEFLTGVASPQPPGWKKSAIVSTRRETLGRGMSISYREPLKMVRGFGAYLYDDTGRRYLDTVNNVAHVGHEHPHVVNAAQRQMGVLNTNTRYLHDNIVRYAEELLATFPPELSVVHFVNSGSEANELALRMARTCSGRKDMIVIEGGYHGNTGACIEMSEYKFNRKGGTGPAPHIHVVPMPDLFRGRLREGHPNPDLGYAKFVASACLQSEAGVAGFIHESILSCGGQIVLPHGYLAAAYEAVRLAGGICIADEVQVGFGRVGDTFWGFELQNVVPDVVTLGKPIGNGHPLGAVVTTREVADAFANGMEYFNTFGGNPVSCAVGSAVLEVIREEGLQENALKVGEWMKEELRGLQNEFPLIGEVRGHGLFLGFELVNDLETREPATARAAYFSNRMRELGILTSVDGPDENVIKLKPPICFSKKDGELFLRRMKQVFGEDFMKDS